jgi:hypothetical protein
VAIMHWWGVGVNAVWRWRKAFGVDRVNNPGSNRLVRANSKKGSERIRTRVFTKAERARHRAINRQFGLSRNLKLRWKGREWKRHELSLLGKWPDAEVARRIGRTENAVRVRRGKLEASP